MIFSKKKENLIIKKQLNHFLSKKIKSIEIEPRVEEFLNAYIFIFVKKIIEEGCILAKIRKGRILQAKDMKFSIFKSLKESSGGVPFRKRTRWLKKKVSKKKEFD
mmetsp:Transcript_525/g.1234  ORF Transcript_525/g.1234 Transcript_525/m.1234 type:complete len:105 (+) Transcript_525:3133-3447(+)